MTPRPLHCGHAPSEFAENRAGLTPCALAKALRIGSSIPVHVAAFERAEPLIASWVMTVASAPLGREPGMSEDLPEPATPVTATSIPRGTSTLTPSRLCVRAPSIRSAPPGSRSAAAPFRRAGTARWAPVFVPDAANPATSPS